MPTRKSKGRPFDAPLVVAYGMGVDSTAVLVQFARLGIVPDLILFADTGGEKPETYRYTPTISRFLESKGFPEILRVAYSGPQIGPNAGKIHSLLEDCLVKRILPSLAYGGPQRKSCSLKWKKEPQNRFCNQWQPAIDAWDRGKRVIKVIGYDNGKADQRRHKLFDDDKYHYWYPLREDWKWDREQCKAEIKRERLKLPLKSACFFCPACRTHELTWLDRNHPELTDQIMVMERLAKAKLTTIKGLWSRMGGKDRPVETMTEWINFSRKMDAEGRGDELASYSEEEPDGYEALGGCCGF